MPKIILEGDVAPGIYSAMQRVVVAPSAQRAGYDWFSFVGLNGGFNDMLVPRNVLREFAEAILDNLPETPKLHSSSVKVI